MPISHKTQTYLIILSRIILGGIFIYAAIGKIIDPYTFAVDIRNYQLIPDGYSNFLALALPWLELICGLLLISGVWEKSAGILISAMVIVFIFGISSAMIRGLDINCGCYKTAADSGEVGWSRLFEDLMFFIMGMVIIFREKFFIHIGRIFKRI
jgi:putative oxidoreductase